MRNIPLLNAAMQQIIDHPELHYQGWYFTKTDCGTAGCFAGWAMMLSGLNADFEHGSIIAAHLFRTARELLGLTEHEAATLFDPFNNRRMLELMVKDLENGDELRDNNFYRQETYREYVP